MRFVYIIFTSIFEFLYFYFSAKRLTNCSIKPTRIDCTFLFMITLLGSLLPRTYPIPVWTSIAGHTLIFSYFLLGFTMKLLDKLLLFILCFTLTFVSQLCILPFTTIMPFQSNTAFSDFLYTFLSLCILILLLMTPLRSIFVKIQNASLVYQLSLISCFLLTVFYIILFHLYPNHVTQNVFYTILCFFILLSANSCILYYDQLLYNQKQELAMYKKNLPIYETLIDDIRARQHAYANRLQTIEQLPSTCHDYASICNAIGHYAKRYKKPSYAYPLLQIKQPLLAASLYQLSLFAEEQNIIIQFDVTNTNLISQVPEYELSDYFCILTQNAIEACSAGDTIYVHIDSKNGMTFFEIRNPVQRRILQTEIHQFFEKYYTTKNSSCQKPRGLGLYHLSNQVQKKKGRLIADCVEHEKKFWIVFCLEL